MKFSVYVTSIEINDPGALVKATNGGPTGPPYFEWVIFDKIKDIYIGKQYDVVITDPAKG